MIFRQGCTDPKYGYIQKIAELEREKKWECVTDEVKNIHECEKPDESNVNECNLRVYKIL